MTRKVGDDEVVEGLWCPFCGNTNPLLGYDDIAEDYERLDLYCNFAGCDTREIVILVTRDGSPQIEDRADVHALNAIYAGNTQGCDRLRAKTLTEILDVDEAEAARQAYRRRTVPQHGQ